MEAAHVSSNTTASGYAFQEIDWYGRTLSGVEMFPVTNQNFSLGSGPSLGYDFWAVDTIGPSLNYFLGNYLSFGVQMDSGRANEHQSDPNYAARLLAGRLEQRRFG